MGQQVQGGRGEERSLLGPAVWSGLGSVSWGRESSRLEEGQNQNCRLAAATQKNTKTPLRPLEEALSHREDAPDDGAVHHKAVLFRTSVSVMSRMIISACDDISGVCCHG